MGGAEEAFDIDSTRIQHLARHLMLQAHGLLGFIGRPWPDDGLLRARSTAFAWQQRAHVPFGRRLDLGSRRSDILVCYARPQRHARLQHIAMVTVVREGADLALAADLEPLEQKRRPQPGAIELGHKHADFKLADRGLNQIFSRIFLFVGSENIYHLFALTSLLSCRPNYSTGSRHDTTPHFSLHPAFSDA
jgi:hypothetical protein